MTKLRAGGPGSKPAVDLRVLLQEAIRCHQDGRTARAERLYRDILAVDPKLLDAVHLMGVLAAQQTHYAKAIDHFERARDLAPQIAQIHANLGKAYYAAGRMTDAHAALERAVGLQPDLAEAWNALGNAQRDLGGLELAMKSFERAIGLSNAMAEPHVNAADVLVDLGAFDGAGSHLDRALSLASNIPEAFAIRARAALAQGLASEALTEADRALALRPAFGEALSVRAQALTALDRLDEARISAAEAARADPSLIGRLGAKAGVAGRQGLRDAAIAYLRRSLLLDPANATALGQLATELLLNGRLEAAGEAASQALALNPDDGMAHYVAAQIALQTCDWDGQDRALAHIRDRIAGNDPDDSVNPFTFMTFDTTGAEQLACARLATLRLAPTPRPAPTPPPARRGDRIRLGYLSSDYSGHATAWLIAGLIERHDRQGFEVVGLSSGPAVQDEMRQRLVRGFDRFIDIREQSDEAADAAIRALGIDILIDLKGYTHGHRAGVLARCPAPVQVSFLGYPGTLGAGFIDYIVADRMVVPPGEEGCFDEQVVRLPDSYQVNTARLEDGRATTRAAQGLPADSVVFCSFNNSYKIARPLFEAWMRILDAVPGSVIWLLGDNAVTRQTLQREAGARGVDPARLVFAERLGQADHLARQGLADLFLDSVPVNAHTTASDALWAGLPVLTTPGRSFIGRVAASVLTAADMSELIAPDMAAYEASAIDLARDRTRLAALRHRLIEGRATSRLFDTDRFARHLERAYETMQARALAGLPPEAFDVPAMDR